MRVSLVLVAVALLALCAVSTASEFPVTVREPVTALSLVRSSTIDKVRDGIDAVQKFVDIFNSKIFEGTKVGMVAEILSKSLSFIVAIIDLIRGSQSEDPLVRYLREQFAEVNAKLDGISLQLQDVKDLIEWSTARAIYARYELEIRAASDKYNAFLKASAAEKPFRQQEFLDYFGPRRAAAFKLYQGIVEQDLIVASSLADAAKQYTKNHRNKVMSFLLAMNRLILRGAQMEIAYQTLIQSNSGGEIIERDWSNRMNTYAHKMKSVEDSVKSVWYNQMSSDVSAFITNYRHLDNRDFSSALYRLLAEKFDWQYWITVVYKDVSGFKNHAVRHVSAGTFFRVAGSRNVVVGRSDKLTSTWSKDRADRALVAADNLNYSTKDCLHWNEAINPLYPVTGNGPTLSMTVCWGCNVWMTAISSRMSYRPMKCDRCSGSKERVNAILFG